MKQISFGILCTNLFAVSTLALGAECTIELHPLNRVENRSHLDFTLAGIQEIHETSNLTNFEMMLEVDRNSVAQRILDDELVFLGKIINLGEKVWKIIESNQPSVEYNLASANAVPKGVTDWKDLEGWDFPTSRSYQITYENLYGMNVVKFKFKVMFIPGGSFRGSGQYLANVMVVPSNIDVSWGYTFNAKAEIPATINRGTTEDPIAAMQLVVNWKVKTVVKYVEASEVFFLQGDGVIEQM